jgi:tetratricopeptide (TPR) repeat protein
MPNVSLSDQKVAFGGQPIHQQRLAAYLELVKALLDCPKGKELALLQANEELVDAAFVQVMEQVAIQMTQQNQLEAANFLRDWAEELRNTLSQLPEATHAQSSPDSGRESLKERSQAYMDLIKELLNCRKGSEPDILRANQTLVDDGLVLQMQNVAAMLAEKGDETDARFLLGLAHQLAETLSPSSPSVHLTLLNKILQAIQETRGNPQVVYGLLQENLEYLDSTFAQVLHNSSEATLKVAEPNQALQLATDLMMFGTLIQQFPAGNRHQNLEIALMSLQAVLPVFECNTHPQQWAVVQKHLGEIYTERPEEGKADNLEAAIACFQSALQVYTYEAFPREWAIVQQKLGEAYHHRVQGDRTENLEHAIAALSAALHVFSPNSNR